MKIGLVLFACGVFAFGACGASAQNTKASSQPVATSSKNNVKPAVPAPKPVPPELTTELAKVEALNGAIADLKLQSGITALENELQKKVQDLFALAAKDGFHYDQATQTFVANAPEQKTTAKTEPEKQ